MIYFSAAPQGRGSPNNFVMLLLVLITMAASMVQASWTNTVQGLTDVDMFFKVNMSTDSYNTASVATGLLAPWDTLPADTTNYQFLKDVYYPNICTQAGSQTITSSNDKGTKAFVIVPKGISWTMDFDFTGFPYSAVCIYGEALKQDGLIVPNTVLLVVMDGGSLKITSSTTSESIEKIYADQMKFTPGIIALGGNVSVNLANNKFEMLPTKANTTDPTSVCTTFKSAPNAPVTLYNANMGVISTTPATTALTYCASISGTSGGPFYMGYLRSTSTLSGGRYFFANNSRVSISNAVINCAPLTTASPYDDIVLNSTAGGTNQRSRNCIDVAFGATLDITNTFIRSQSTSTSRAVIGVHHGSLKITNSILIGNASSMVLADWGTEHIESSGNVYFPINHNLVPRKDNYQTMDFGAQGNVFTTLSPDLKSNNDLFFGNVQGALFSYVALPNRASVTGYNFDLMLGSSQWYPASGPRFVQALNIVNAQELGSSQYSIAIDSAERGNVLLSNLIFKTPLLLNLPNSQVTISNSNFSAATGGIVYGAVNTLITLSSNFTYASPATFINSSAQVNFLSTANSTSFTGQLGSFGHVVATNYMAVIRPTLSPLALLSTEPSAQVFVNDNVTTTLALTIANASPDYQCVFTEAEGKVPEVRVTVDTNGRCATAPMLPIGTYRFRSSVQLTAGTQSDLGVEFAPIVAVRGATNSFYRGWSFATGDISVPNNGASQSFVTCSSTNGCDQSALPSTNMPSELSSDPIFATFSTGVSSSTAVTNTKLTVPANEALTLNLYFVYWQTPAMPGLVTAPGFYSVIGTGVDTDTPMVVSLGKVQSNTTVQTSVFTTTVMHSNSQPFTVYWSSSNNVYLVGASFASMGAINTPTNGGGSSGNSNMAIKIAIPIVGFFIIVAAIVAFILWRKRRMTTSPGKRMNDVELRSSSSPMNSNNNRRLSSKGSPNASRSMLKSSNSSVINQDKYRLHGDVFSLIQESHFYAAEHATFPLTFSITRLDFGMGNNKCEINQQMKDYVLITNKTDKNVYVNIFLPPSSSSALIDSDEKMITLKAGKSATVTFTAELLCTTKLMEKFAVQVEGFGHTFLFLHLESVLSTQIDFEEIVFYDNIGEGGFGVVYRGVWRGQEVAVKMLKTKNLSKELLEEVNREVDLMNKLRHPNIVSFVGSVKTSVNLCLVSEYIAMGSLGKVLYKQNRKLTLKEIIRVCLDTAKGCNFLHLNGILHRDLKPDNILVVSLAADAPVCVKLTDFGTSKEINEIKSEQITSGIGTPIYMANEILDKRSYDKSADVYSFGMMFYELILGEIPFSEFKNNWEIPRYIIAGNRPTRGMENAPQPIVQLINECWMPDPNSRPPFDDIIPRLETILSTL
ncbi:hypothetical protein SAMD00019534_116510 [Acytostelium subglobosum LB1]|uniref:hypothetical protein n=1 Tax=Acytostelium subglobosum LB1 TaxID=1410327 RepID=UPI00064507FF|nr:hypothetical protein SAMD00019534_116510 [Acytostelium subglobosum LB1]GAM28475.1 hypothetical protein SAMD00019534_116510 [Acytostelium subglobosum LB1]|eukprot:XP_012748514.1 hypothetical protein SAMD00019534_116510 [Acytostelium subglobosum LB1]